MDQLKQAQNDGVVIGLKAVAGVQPRLDIDVLLTTLPDTFNLFLIALKELRDDPDSSKIMGYYQIAGIHGLPKVFWDGVQDQEKLPTNRDQSGYCAHSTLTFPTWHRPYLAMLEQTIYMKILDVAERFPDAQKPKYRAAAQKFRLPYWDYYRPRNQGNTVFPGVKGNGRTSFNYDFSVPQIFTVQQVVIRSTANDTLTLMDNPLAFFPFPAQGSIPETQWSIVGADAATFSRARTTRYPTSQQPLNGDTIKLNAAVNKSREANTGYILDMVLDPPYSSYPSFATDTASTGASGSLEDIHGLYHILIGGNGGDGAYAGHMSRVPVAAFDPIFWMHHCQIDRWFAIWQAARPQSWFPRGNLQTQPLLPFRTSKSANGQTFWSSDGSRYPDAFGYTYPDLLVGDAKAVQTAFQQHYQWSVRTSSRPFGTPPPDMRPLDLGKAQAFQYTSVSSAPVFTTSARSAAVTSPSTSRALPEEEPSFSGTRGLPKEKSAQKHPHLSAIKNAIRKLFSRKEATHASSNGSTAPGAEKKSAATPASATVAPQHAPAAAPEPPAAAHAQVPMLASAAPNEHAPISTTPQAPSTEVAAIPSDQKPAPTAAPAAQAPPTESASQQSTSFTNLQNSDVAVAVPGQVDESKVNREWYVDDIVERLALNDAFTIYFFIGEFDKHSTGNFIVEPSLAGMSHIFTAPVEACDNCGRQEEQAHLITHTTPITPMLLDYVEMRQLQSLAPEYVEPFLVKNLRWRVVTVNGQAVDPRTVAGLKIGVSSKLSPIPPATGAPTYQEFPHVVEQIIANSS